MPGQKGNKGGGRLPMSIEALKYATRLRAYNVTNDFLKADDIELIEKAAIASGIVKADMAKDVNLKGDLSITIKPIYFDRVEEKDDDRDSLSTS